MSNIQRPRLDQPLVPLANPPGRIALPEASPVPALAKPTLPSVEPPPPWSTRTVTRVPADGKGTKAPSRVDDDVASTSPDKLLRRELEELG